MDYDLIEQSNDRYIYMVENNGNKFYMVIPSSGNNANMVLNLFSDNVLDNVKKIPNLNDKIVIVPELASQYVDYLKVPRASYEQASGYFSGMINMAQGILVKGILDGIKKQIAPKVYFNNSREFSGFINWYVGVINRPDRFVIGNIFSVNDESKVSNVAVNQSVMGVGSDIPLNNGVDYVQEEQQSNELENNRGMVKTRKREPGFVSYVLLGVLVAIMSLVFLYMLL